MYSPVFGSTRTRSPVERNSGTWITTPLLKVEVEAKKRKELPTIA